MVLLPSKWQSLFSENVTKLTWQQLHLLPIFVGRLLTACSIATSAPPYCIISCTESNCWFLRNNFCSLEWLMTAISFPSFPCNTHCCFPWFKDIRSSSKFHKISPRVLQANEPLRSNHNCPGEECSIIDEFLSLSLLFKLLTHRITMELLTICHNHFWFPLLD